VRGAPHRGGNIKIEMGHGISNAERTFSAS